MRCLHFSRFETAQLYSQIEIFNHQAWAAESVQTPTQILPIVWGHPNQDYRCNSFTAVFHRTHVSPYLESVFSVLLSSPPLLPAFPHVNIPRKVGLCSHFSSRLSPRFSQFSLVIQYLCQVLNIHFIVYNLLPSYYTSDANRYTFNYFLKSKSVNSPNLPSRDINYS